MVVFVGARGVDGPEALDMYQHPDKYNLLGETGEEMMEACAQAWGWESGAELNAEVDRVLAQGDMPIIPLSRAPKT